MPKNVWFLKEKKASKYFDAALIKQLNDHYAQLQGIEKPTPQQYHMIIDDCERLLESIKTLEEREKLTGEHRKIYLEILNLQKKYVNYFFSIKNIEPHDNSWELIRRLTKSEDGLKNLTPGSESGEDMLYWQERRFKGRVDLYLWATSEIDFTETEQIPNVKFLQTYRETLENPILTVLPNIFYAENPEEFELKIENGRVYETDGIKPVDTLSKSHGEIDFVAVDNKLYSDLVRDNKKYPGERRHVSTVSGKPVIFAGTLKIADGKILEITVNSGHYKSNRINLYNFLDMLHKQGVDLSTINVISTMGGKPINAQHFYDNRGVAMSHEFSYADQLYRDVRYAGGLNYEEKRKLLDEAVNLGHVDSIVLKLQCLCDGSYQYKRNVEEAKEMLKYLQDNKLIEPSLVSQLTKTINRRPFLPLIQRNNVAEENTNANPIPLQHFEARYQDLLNQLDQEGKFNLHNPKIISILQELILLHKTHFKNESNSLTNQFLNKIDELVANNAYDLSIPQHKQILFLLHTIHKSNDVLSEISKKILYEDKVLSKNSENNLLSKFDEHKHKILAEIDDHLEKNNNSETTKKISSLRESIKQAQPGWKFNRLARNWNNFKENLKKNANSNNDNKTQKKSSLFPFPFKLFTKNTKNTKKQLPSKSSNNNINNNNNNNNRP